MTPPVRTSLIVLAAAAAAVLATCGTTDSARTHGLDAFRTVYEVLTHPRCANCHPAGDTPLVGDRSEVHPQNVQRGPFGMGLYALRCENCHLAQNTAGLHQPPGVPGWHMPRPETPLVFEGRSPVELARQLADPKQNGGRTPAQLLQHAAEDPLVLWGWNPGEGRAPVPIPHDVFADAMRAWVTAGCPVPE